MLLNTAFLLLGLLSSPASAACFLVGAEWDDTQASAVGAAEYWCRKATGGQAIAGLFHSGDTKSRCSNLYEGTKMTSNRVDFKVKWGGRGDAKLDAEECLTRLKTEIMGCSHGGSKDEGEWTFT
ncbi:hypothetical protein C8034_v011521 [Colletotrichum sidae]|uniref:Secreted protein n=1 Tax=Colletotrichum sidae TaxID=1347389 RepID=A0A4R8TKX1_9PEZI|nr:hypothetical protein C8034_v011521 [Colletotrichum sidae]